MSATPQVIDFTCVLDPGIWSPIARIARAEARKSRSAQGLPVKVSDPSVLRRIAVAMGGRQFGITLSLHGVLMGVSFIALGIS